MDTSIDSREFERHGMRFRVTVHPDYDASPHDADCYSAEDIAAWKADQWRYVILSVELVHPEVPGDAHLGGVEWDNLPGAKATYLDLDYYLAEADTIYGLADEAAEDALKCLQLRIAKLSGKRDFIKARLPQVVA